MRVRALGVDGCRGGWIAAWVAPDGTRGFKVVPHAKHLAEFTPECAYIDMPIGLPETGPRPCDLPAQRMLGRARSRVFLGARRPLLEFLGDYASANRWAKTDGKGLSRQMFNILPKIAEIDGFMTPARQKKFREAHPELAFLRFDGGAALPGKKTPLGLRRRKKLVRALGFAEIDKWLKRLRGSGAKADDLLDACVLAAAALAPGGMVAGQPERDARGLRMEIWF
jgi:predicted RNase H-like nuclease